MTTAIIGVGRLGSALASDLVAGGEPVVIAASNVPDAVAQQLGNLARAATVNEAIDDAAVVIFAVWLDVTRQLIEQYRSRLAGKVVIDPSNPVAVDANGNLHRSLPEGVSSGSLIAALLPPNAHFAKAFGTVSAESLAAGANRKPERAVLFYATDDEQAQAAVEQLIEAAGFAPLKVGGVDQSLRIEMYGDLHDFGGLQGRLVNLDEARAAVSARAPI
jgi:predicted dinucleotide-binding enzyme